MLKIRKSWEPGHKIKEIFSLMFSVTKSWKTQDARKQHSSANARHDE